MQFIKCVLQLIRYAVAVSVQVSVYVFAGGAILFLNAIGAEKHADELFDDIFA